MPQAIDSEVLERAVIQSRIVVTNDKDFGDMVFRDRLPHCGIILLRLSDELAASKVQVLSAVLREHADKLTGTFVVATEDNIRIRSQA